MRKYRSRSIHLCGDYAMWCGRCQQDVPFLPGNSAEAMICTMSGLAVSITGLWPVHYFRTRAVRETELLADEFSF